MCLFVDYDIITFMEQQKEHILVCLSASPSNAHIIETAAQMAKAFDALFTALYVSTPDAPSMTEEDKARLQRNVALSEKLGATVATVYGDDVVFQIAEYARLSRVTKVVLGRSSIKRKPLGRQPLTDRLTAIAPDIEIHIIPDNAAEIKYRGNAQGIARRILPNWRDILITLGVLVAATGIGMFFAYLRFTEANIITVYVLSVLITAIFTQNFICNVVGAIGGVVIFNLLFVEPRFSLHVSDAGTYVTFAIMLAASLISGMLAHRLKYTAKQSAQSAYRTKVLFDTDRLLQQQTDSDELLFTMAQQLVRLTDRDAIVYSVADGKLLSSKVFLADRSDGAPFDEEAAKKCLTANNTVEFDGAVYRAVAITDRVYGVVGVRVGNRPFELLENSIFVSIVGECALAIDNVHNRKEQERATLEARQEQLRANMLRAISHDLRTPLTSIAGNADFLLNSYDKLDDGTRKQIFSDIYDDSMWLYALVENLLSVTRLNGTVQLNLTCELAEDLIDGALRRIHRRSNGYVLTKKLPDVPLLVNVDTKLILQVLVNLVDNALKYTPEGSEITLSAEPTDNGVMFSVADNGAGIADALKDKVFEMFYTGDNAVADGRRSLGLGLALCKSIVTAHGGTMSVTDNVPHGAVFSFVLPKGGSDVGE